MKITVLTTGTNNTRVLYEPLQKLGHVLAPIVYDEMPTHNALPKMVADTGPDVVLYIGALAEHHGKPVPTVAVLGEIGKRFPMVHLCCDGAEPVWWQRLAEYYDQGHFALQVNIDGVRTGPIGERGLTMLCPLDPDTFTINRPWTRRYVPIGFGGNEHQGARKAMLGELVKRRIVIRRERDEEAGPDGYVDFMASCRCIWNHPMTGGGTSMHVKARILEAALAGCLVLEARGSPAEFWFTPDKDYLSYSTVDDVARLVDHVQNSPKEAHGMAMRLRDKIVADHTPAIFWSHVFDRLGMIATDHVLRQPPYQYWTRPGDPQSAHSATVGMPAGFVNPPRLIEAGPNSNVVLYGSRAYLIPHRLGAIDLDKIKVENYPAIKTFETAAQARAAMK